MTTKQEKKKIAPAPKKQQETDPVVPNKYQGYLVMGGILSVLVIPFFSYLVMRSDATPLKNAAKVTPETTLEPKPLMENDIVNDIVLDNMSVQDLVVEANKIEQAELAPLMEGTPAEIMPTPDVAPVAIQPWHVDNRDRLKTLMMEKLAVDALFYNSERGRPFSLDIEIVEKFISDAGMKAEILELAPYAAEGLPRFADIERQARSILARTKHLMPTKEDRIASKFIKSILHISKKEPLAPAFIAAMETRNIPRALHIAEKLETHGYPLQGIIRQLQDFKTAHALVQKAKIAYHTYFIELFNKYTPEHS